MSSSPLPLSGSSSAPDASRCRSWRPRPVHPCPIHRQDLTRTPAMPWPDPQNQLAFLNGAVLLLGVLLYALLGGADFGGGIWDLLAGGPRAAEQRQVIAHAIGPIWEANHVWLIFVIVLVFTVFPPVFAALSIALYIPLSLALLGIVFRGAAFIFCFFNDTVTTE